MKTLLKNSYVRKAFACMMMFALVITAVNVPAVSAKKAVAGKTIKLNKKKATLTVGEKVTLKAKVNPKKATVTWKTSNKKVATVKAGKVTAKAEGTAKITASIKTAAGKTKKAVCKVTVKAADTESGGGTEGGGTQGGGDTQGGGGTAAEEMKPVDAPAVQPDNAAAPELVAAGTATMFIASDADAQLLSVTQDFAAAGTITLSGKATAAGTMKTFYVDTGIAVSSNVYKVSAANLKIRGNDVTNKNTDTTEFAMTESAKGTWEIVFINGTGAGDTKLKGGSNGSVAADDEIICTYTVTAQTPEEAAANRAKAMKRIPLTAGDGNNKIEATVKVTGVPAGGAQLGVSFELNNSIANASTGAYETEHSYLTIKDGKLEIYAGNNDTNTVDAKILNIAADGEYTFTLAGLHNATDIKSLEFQSNVSNKDEKFMIQMMSIKVNDQGLVIANTPKKTTTTFRYMCDAGTMGTWQACARNIYNYTKDASSSTSDQLAWAYVGTAIKNDDISFDNISRNYYK